MIRYWNVRSYGVERMAEMGYQAFLRWIPWWIRVSTAANVRGYLIRTRESVGGGLATGHFRRKSTNRFKSFANGRIRREGGGCHERWLIGLRLRFDKKRAPITWTGKPSWRIPRSWTPYIGDISSGSISIPDRSNLFRIFEMTNFSFCKSSLMDIAY